MDIRLATAADRAAIEDIILPVIREGATYALERDMTADAALAYWMSSDKVTFVAETNGVVVGTYYLRTNQAGGGKHVANCGYMTRADQVCRGIAGRMCAHSLDYARAHGFRAMQFNFVVSTNVGAVRLWQKMGFEILCHLPMAFLHPQLGYVDAHVMYQSL